MSRLILVTGGTGTLGRHIVKQLRDSNNRVRVLSRHATQASDGVESVVGDLSTGQGVAAAMQGVDIIVHCAGSGKGDEVKAQNLIAATANAKIKRIVYISVVGADKIPLTNGIDRAMFGYFGSKWAAEKIIVDSSIPWTVLRATQFHELLHMVIEQLTRLPIIPIPAGFKFQPIAAEEVATRLVELTLEESTGSIETIAGPQVLTLTDLVREYLRAHRKRRLLMPIWLIGNAARAFKEGVNLAPERAVGRVTWKAFLAKKVNNT